MEKIIKKEKNIKKEEVVLFEEIIKDEKKAQAKYHMPTYEGTLWHVEINGKRKTFNRSHLAEDYYNDNTIKLRAKSKSFFI